MAKFFWALALSLMVANIAQAEEFVDKRFYEKMNPLSDRGSWIQITPSSIIEDYSASYWFPGDEPDLRETKCELLENKIGYIKMKCDIKNYRDKIVQAWIMGKDDYYPCAVRVKYSMPGYGGAYWIPDGKHKESRFDSNQPFSQDNNNAYKDCPEE